MGGRATIAVVAGRVANAERVRDGLVRAANRGLAVDGFARTATRILRRAVPFDGTCLVTLDPATLLPTGEIVENGLPAEATMRLNDIEMREPDVNKFSALAEGTRPAASLSEATSGDLDRSLRQRELRRPHGLGDELRAVLPDPTGTWGALTLMREAGARNFTAGEVRLVASLAEVLAEGVRRATLYQAATAAAADHDAEPGLLVLGPDDTVRSSNRAADRWLDELRAGPGSGLPVVVHAAAARARRPAGPDRGDGRAAPVVTAGLARARVRTGSGRWVVVRGSLLGDDPAAPVAVLLEPARAPELAPLIVEHYGFTTRERRITELVARGLSTHEVAARLHLSAYTVQDHLKAIFTKSGTGSRGELVARLFVDHHASLLD